MNNRSLLYQQQSSKKKPIYEDFEKDDDDPKEEEGGSGGGGCDGGDGKRKRGGGGGRVVVCCQADKCGADLREAKRYYRRHKVCEIHAKAPIVVVAGLKQRFCQQCSRFHELSEFDEAKRSCRRRLAGHNERRRKSSSEMLEVGQGSSHRGVTQMKKSPCRLTEERGRVPITLSSDSSYKQFKFR